MAENEKISVIVPAYNNAPWLPSCLDSLLAQTYENLEIIVVDDGSTDDTQAVLADYCRRDARIRAIYQPNGGVTSARLHGVREAAGEWIGFVDGDDMIDADMYQHLMDNARKYHADISHCGYQMVFGDGRINYFHNTGKLVQHGRDEALRELLSGTMIEPGLCNKLFQRELLEGLLAEDSMDKSIRINEDLLMNFKMFCQAERSVFEDFCPYHYIVRQGSASRQALNEHRIYDPIRVKEQILALAPESTADAARAAFLSSCINVYNSLTLQPGGQYRDDLRKVRGMIQEHFAWAGLLGKKQRLLAQIIRFTPWMYGPLYGFYAAHIMRNPYQ